MISDNDMKRCWETDEPIDNALINHGGQVDTINNAIPNNPAKYRMRCYNLNDDLMLTTNSMTSANEWIGRNDGYFMVERARLSGKGGVMSFECADKISDVVERLGIIRDKYGDLPVRLRDPDTGWILTVDIAHCKAEEDPERVEIQASYGE